MNSVYLNIEYWFSKYNPPLLPRGQVMALVIGFAMVLFLLFTQSILKKRRPQMNSLEKKYWRKLQSFAINQTVIVWILIFFSWFGVQYLGSKGLLLIWGIYVLVRFVFLAYEGRDYFKQIFKK